MVHVHIFYLAGQSSLSAPLPTGATCTRPHVLSPFERKNAKPYLITRCDTVLNDVRDFKDGTQRVRAHVASVVVAEAARIAFYRPRPSLRLGVLNPNEKHLRPPIDGFCVPMLWSQHAWDSAIRMANLTYAHHERALCVLVELDLHTDEENRRLAIAQALPSPCSKRASSAAPSPLATLPLDVFRRIESAQAQSGRLFYRAAEGSHYCRVDRQGLQ